mmetsp:Transcript_9294/g.19808  ORF Transcript_9294/g.19808 Transcript_9294/m.19808 type:complete len:92 (+) Transcript_9294:32-307(+)
MLLLLLCREVVLMMSILLSISRVVQLRFDMNLLVAFRASDFVAFFVRKQCCQVRRYGRKMIPNANIRMKQKTRIINEILLILVKNKKTVRM